MIRSIVLSLAAVLAALAAFAAGADDDSKLREVLTSRYPNMQIELVRPAPWAGWYEVATPSNLLYTNADGTLLFSGRVFDTQTKENLTARRWNELRSIRFEDLP